MGFWSVFVDGFGCRVVVMGSSRRGGLFFVRVV